MHLLNPFRYANAGPQFADVVMLCHFDGTNGSTTLVNSTTRGNTPTVGGNAALDTSQQLFGTASVSMDGATDFVQNASHADFAFGTGDVTVEFAVRPTTLATDAYFDMRPASTNGAYPFIWGNSSGQIHLYVNGATRISSGGAPITTGSWHRIAWCRSAGTSRLFVNGVEVGTAWPDTTNYLQSRMLLGNNDITFGDAGCLGRFDEYRVTLAAWYSSNYTVAAAAFPDS